MKTTKSKTNKDLIWLNSEPDESEIEDSPYGGKHIPIDKIRVLLDRLNGCVTKYQLSYYKNGRGDLSAAASLELTVTIDGKERTVTGAYNLTLHEAPNGFWNGTLKSECVKNAASELGKRLGRDLNKDMPKQEPINYQEIAKKINGKPKPDSKVMQQFLKAVEKGDKAAQITLANIYDIKTEA